ncbi:4Fe4S-binding leucine-rich repeat protein [Bradyrhizobium sp. SSUT18]|uniref:4Fe4S-binding leucine-rich repeat protein n=1 Tax=unclassified Bradyrhizobium TaxID=2631580 RepID=UPI0024483A44|nr:4Fe4S-binding leucine-rich repeat protein [Bradyrhizobium sp. SSUT18]MDH2404689.1 4Fe4S-binding leucine-rich repeat protein [Bradyrhizobium sp. SSUT18]
MVDDIDKALDWEGNRLDCASCEHLALSGIGGCRLKHACVNDRCPRGIERFFECNPDLADGHLSHPHFEVRAIAAKFASVFLLQSLIDDPNEKVQWNAMLRLPRRCVLQLRKHPNPELRKRVASLLEGEELLPMASDEYYYVRLVVASRIEPMLLLRMVDDEEAEVRRVVAQRIPNEWLLRMIDDREASVRLEIARRLPMQLVSLLLHDPDWRIRLEVASRAPAAQIYSLVNDPYSLVREVASSRIAGDRR